MIDLTPLEVRKKKGDFRRAMRGYDPQAVDDFLDLVADRLEQLVRENVSLAERVGSTESRVADYRDRERALTEALVTAQEMREDMRRQMEREVELLRREAEAEADEIRNAAAQIREREEENIRRLRARQGQFVQSYRSFLERELAELAVIAQTLDYGKESESAPAPPRKRARRAEPTRPPESSLVAPTVIASEPTIEPLPPFEAELLVPFEPEPVEPESFDLEPFEPEPLEPEAHSQSEIEFEMREPPRAVDVPDDEDRGDSDGWVSTLLEGKGD